MLSKLPPRRGRALAQPPVAEEPSQPRSFYPADLPRLEKDPFGWTPEELAEAVATARRWRDGPTFTHKEDMQ